jgi:hypothetical protein
MSGDVDEIALERALNGDRGVWANLTPDERDEALRRARERRLSELAVNAEWRRELAPHTRGRKTGGVLPHATAAPDWMVRLAEAAGFSGTESFMKAARKAARE